MRVGILTFHHARNYGALLQAYALRQAIASLGHEAVLVNYIPEHFRNRSVSWLRPGWRTHGPRLALEMILRTQRFDRFRKKELLETRHCADKEALARQVQTLDALVVGSDQVWNLNFVHSEDRCYFLDFPLPKNLRRISYAACCGQKDQPPAQVEKIAGLMERFHTIGVRNDVTAEFVKTLSGRDSTVVADPTLLIDFAQLDDGPAPKTEYILTYAIGEKPPHFYERIFDSLRREYGLPVWAIADADRLWSDTPFPGADHNLFGIMPGQFVHLFKHARFIVADSFHGSIFSVKFNRPFLSVNNGGQKNVRLRDLAERYGLTHRVKGFEDTIDFDQLMQTDDLPAIRERFDAHKAASYTFISNALEGTGDSHE